MLTGSRVVWEHHNLNMYCHYPLKISVKSATYGLPSRHCHSYLSLPIVKEFCEGEGGCSVKAGNNIFGDPCHGVYKRLQVKWSCVRTHISKYGISIT